MTGVQTCALPIYDGHEQLGDIIFVFVDKNGNEFYIHEELKFGEPSDITTISPGEGQFRQVLNIDKYPVKIIDSSRGKREIVDAGAIAEDYQRRFTGEDGFIEKERLLFMMKSVISGSTNFSEVLEVMNDGKKLGQLQERVYDITYIPKIKTDEPRDIMKIKKESREALNNMLSNPESIDVWVDKKKDGAYERNLKIGYTAQDGKKYILSVDFDKVKTEGKLQIKLRDELGRTVVFE